MRHPISPAADDAVESSARRHQRGPAVGRDHTLDQRINDRIGDATDVLRPPHGGGARSKKGPQRIARRVREPEPLHHDIEIEIVHAFAILHGVDNSQIGIDSQYPEILDEGNGALWRPDRRAGTRW